MKCCSPLLRLVTSKNLSDVTSLLRRQPLRKANVQFDPQVGPPPVVLDNRHALLGNHELVPRCHHASVSLTTRSRPSSVLRLTAVPANASTKSIFLWARRSLPSLVYSSWGRQQPFCKSEKKSVLCCSLHVNLSVLFFLRGFFQSHLNRQD
jgi:hypothetical protein